MRKLIMWVLASLGVASTLSITTAAPAAAEIKFCSGAEPVYCDIAYQKYNSGGVTRSSVDGYFNGWKRQIAWPLNVIEGKIHVKDIADNDGWRARVWVNVYANCWCIDRDNRVGEYKFDAFTSDAKPQEFVWRANGFDPYYYAVQVIVGRYKGSTGACEPLDQSPFNPGCGEYVSSEQRFYLTID